MKRLQGFIAGFVVACLLLPVLSFASSSSSIEVVLNTVKIAVNGTPLTGSNFLYKGTTYAPVRLISEAIGMRVGWDNGSVTINDPVPAAAAPSISPEAVPAPAAAPAPGTLQAIFPVGTQTPTVDPMAKINRYKALSQWVAETYHITYQVTTFTDKAFSSDRMMEAWKGFWLERIATIDYEYWWKTDPAGYATEIHPALKYANDMVNLLQ